jgi:hypothetical protein
MGPEGGGVIETGRTQDSAIPGVGTVGARVDQTATRVASGLRRALTAAVRVVRVVGSAASRWFADGSLGHDADRELGRHTGARC